MFQKTYISVTLILLTIFTVSKAQDFNYNFNISNQGWVGSFAEYPVGQDALYELEFAWRALPHPLDTTQNSLYISGKNLSDDLFMFIKKEITGLQPNTNYAVVFNIGFASIYPTNAIGVGGPPGEGVTMKAGVSLLEPDTIMGLVNNSPFWYVNIDKSNQISPGNDMDTVGHVGVSDTTTQYTLISNTNITHPFHFTTDSSGKAWLIVGTDSGFEGKTSLYYNTIDVSFTTITSIDHIKTPKDIIIYPNPIKEHFNISSDHKILKIEVFNFNGERLKTIHRPSYAESINLADGPYIFKIYTNNNQIIRKVIVKSP